MPARMPDPSTDCEAPPIQDRNHEQSRNASSKSSLFTANRNSHVEEEEMGDAEPYTAALYRELPTATQPKGAP